jgi:hypothetical protein
MRSVVIRKEKDEKTEPQFVAIAGDRRSIGRTMGEALDALTADWGEDASETAVFIQRFQPDPHFTEAQYCRMQELLARRATLSPAERAELEALIDTEVDATIARTATLTRPSQP